jgi:hypothetical protein
MAEDQSKRDNLAHRMSKLLGVPLSNIQMLMPLIPKEDVDRLSLLPDDQFLSESAKVINIAQRKQYEDDAALSAGGAAPAAEDLGSPTLRPPGDTPETEEMLGGEPPPVIEIGQSARAKKLVGGRQNIAIIAGGSVAALLVIGAGVYLVMNLLKSPDQLSPDPDQRTTATGTVPGPSEEPVPPEVGDDDKALESALKVGPDFNLTVENAELLGKVDGRMTVEMWIKPVASKDMVDIALMSAGDGEMFRLAVKAESDAMKVEFFVNGAGAEFPQFVMPKSRKWMHVAGVYDATAARSLRLYVDGKLQAEGKVKEPGAMVGTGYKLVSMACEGNIYSLVDDIRLSSVPRYTQNFEAVRLFEVDDNVLSLLHLEDRKDQRIVDAISTEFELVRDDLYWVDVKTHLHEYIQRHRKVEFPAEMLVAVEMEFGIVGKKQFLKEWAALSNEKREHYLKTLEGP